MPAGNRNGYLRLVTEQTEHMKTGAPADEVIRANVSFYREAAPKYERYESWTFDPSFQRMLAADLDLIASHLGHVNGRRVKCLDCGGGTGNLSIRLLQRGWDVTVVDVSREMLEILEDKCAAQGLVPRIRNCSVEEFLETDDAHYDLISFASVLHHLHSYCGVVELAAPRLQPKGIFYSNFDPVPPKHRMMTQVFDSMDTLLAKLLFDPADVLPGIKRRVTKLVGRASLQHGRAIAGAGDLAEYHAKSGVDDAQIVDLLKHSGFAVLEHCRYTTGRTRASQEVNRWVGLLRSFKIIAQRRH